MDQTLATSKGLITLKPKAHSKVPMERPPSEIQQNLFFSTSAMGVQALHDCEDSFADDPSQAIADLGAAVMTWCVLVERALWVI
ncbi:hypothetical protein CMK13_01825 [Candidatus Poribacteria bacterium]|nr:hypothetical protein [Candidatus Poribacteria bacterium]OUW01947.1 MAG: hypothetical protein CBD16_04790 [Betaproteobacteria bacterium TMED156]